MTQNEEGQREKLKVVLERASQALGVPTWGHGLKWSVDAVHSKNVVAIVHLLVALARHFRAPVRARLPENVVVSVVSVTKRNGQLVPAKLQEQLTRTYECVFIVLVSNFNVFRYIYFPIKIYVIT